MKLKIFIPDYDKVTDGKKCLPLFYVLPLTDGNLTEAVKQYGDWINKIEIVSDISFCDIVMPAYYINNYYSKKNSDWLLKINEQAIAAGKLTVCWTSGDEGITPPLKNYHLFRHGGYFHKNKGNEFSFPSFFADPVYKYYNGKLPLIEIKTFIPIIGFCGQGRASIIKYVKDIARNIYYHLLKFLNKRIPDLENIESPVTSRSAMLDTLEKSSVVETNFIRHKLYRAGVKNKADKEKDNIIFYENIRSSQYIFCYRGTGNFSVRLYETLAAGRIPFIINSDNNLPWRQYIDWSIFPQTNTKADRKSLDKILSDFHDNLSDEDFINLQRQARKIWEEYLTYQAFMDRFIKQYMELSKR